jgi:hypothetical protein
VFDSFFIVSGRQEKARGLSLLEKRITDTGGSVMAELSGGPQVARKDDPISLSSARFHGQSQRCDALLRYRETVQQIPAKFRAAQAPGTPHLPSSSSLVCAAGFRGTK